MHGLRMTFEIISYRWTLLLCFCSLVTLSLCAVGPQGGYQDSLVDDFKMKFHKDLEKLKIQKKITMEGVQKFVPFVNSSDPLQVDDDSVTVACTAVEETKDSELAFVVSSGNVSQVLNSTIVPIFTFRKQLKVVKLQAFVYGNDIWFLAYHTNSGNKHFIKMYEYGKSYVYEKSYDEYNKTVYNKSYADEESLKRSLRIPLSGPALISTVKFGSKVFAAVASTNAKFPELKLYQWMRTQFNKVFSRHFHHNFAALDIWHIEGTVYVAFSFALQKELVIQRFVDYHQRLDYKVFNVQVLDIEAYVIRHFVDSSNRYLICSTGKSVVLYWWSGTHFLQQQKNAFYKPVLDIAVHSIGGKTVIAVVLHDEVQFLAQNDAARYVKAKERISFNTPQSLESVVLWRERNALFMIPVTNINRTEVYQLSLQYRMSELERDKTFEGCVETLNQSINIRQEKMDLISSTLDKKIWLLSSNQNLASLKVNGSIKSLTKSKIRSLVLEIKPTSLLSAENLKNQLNYTASKITAELHRTLRNSIKQEIGGNLGFENFTVNKATAAEFSQHISLNKVLTSRLPDSLKITGNQEFSKKVNIWNVNCIKVETTISFCGNKMEDYVLLSDSPQIITGNFTFINVTTKGDVFATKNEINDLDIHNFVQQSKPQKFTNKTEFKYLQAEVIQTKEGVNEISFKDGINAVLLGSKYITLSLDFASNLIVYGDLNITSVNIPSVNKTMDLFELYSKSVKKNEMQEISGDKRFRSIVINQTITITGLVNNFSTSNLMTLHTNQQISGNITFSGSTQFPTVETEFLNGHDLSEEAIKKHRNDYSKVRGAKIFKQDLRVSDITMDEGVCLDYFDPSAEVEKIVNKNFEHMESLYFLNTPITVGDVTINGDITVSEDRAGSTLIDLLENVWLKNSEQDISSLELKKLTARNGMHASKINGITVKDLVTVNGNVNISSFKKFTDDVRLESMDVKDGKLNITELWKPKLKPRIWNTITVETSVIEGDLYIKGGINGFDRFMHRKDFQTFIGEVTLETIHMQDLILPDLNLEYLSNTNFFERAVTSSGNLTLVNKNFASIKGGSLNNLGTFNGHLLSRVVTTNTKQNITAPFKFNNSLLFKSINVDNFFGEVRLDDIVYRNETQKVSNKLFNGTVVASELILSGDINEIDINSLDKNAFYKSKDNVLEAKMYVNSNLNATHIQVSENSTIDGVKIADLIQLNKAIRLDSFKSSAVTVNNIIVNGLVNRCDLTSIFQHALFSKKDAQTVTQKFLHIDTLVVEGNLNVEEMLNAMWINDRIAILKGSSELKFNGEMIFENMYIDRAVFLDAVNGQYLNNLTTDVVRRSVPQKIYGAKTFNKQISVKKLNMKRLESIKVCGVDMTQLFHMSIRRLGGNQTLLVKKLPSLYASNVTVKGNLNKLNLPDDVVLANKDEFITTETIMNGTLNVSSGLDVQGDIDGVNFTKFLVERLTLRDSMESSAELNFTQDVKIIGSTIINGTINDIEIGDIVNIRQASNIFGNKTFENASLTVKSNLMVNGRINKLYVEDLQKKVLQASQNETVRDVVQFSKINTTDLMCRDINRINFTDFYNAAHSLSHHTYERLDNYTERIMNHVEKLYEQKDSQEHMLSLFSYFEQQEILKLMGGLVQRFLPVFEDGVILEKYELHATQMVIWVKNNKKKNDCRKTMSFVADTGNGTLKVVSKEPGKIFPFSLRSHWKSVVGFVVKAEHNASTCFGKLKTVEVQTLFLRDSKTNTTNEIESPDNATLEEVILVEIHEIFMIMAFDRGGTEERIFVYRYHPAQDTWSLYQKFYKQSFTSLDWVAVEHSSPKLPEYYLAVSGDNKNPGVTIYEWDFDDRHELIFKTNFTTSVSSYVLWVSTEKELFLLLAKEMTEVQKTLTSLNSYNEPLVVYSMGDENMILHHTVSISGAKYLETFALAGEVFVLASSPYKETLYILHYRGYNGFEIIQEIPVPGITSTRLYTVESHLYLAISSSKIGYSRILKATIRGGRQGLD